MPLSPCNFVALLPQFSVPLRSTKAKFRFKKRPSQQVKIKNLIQSQQKDGFYKKKRFSKTVVSRTKKHKSINLPKLQLRPPQNSQPQKSYQTPQQRTSKRRQYSPHVQDSKTNPFKLPTEIQPHLYSKTYEKQDITNLYGQQYMNIACFHSEEIPKDLMQRTIGQESTQKPIKKSPGRAKIKRQKRKSPNRSKFPYYIKAKGQRLNGSAKWQKYMDTCDIKFTSLNKIEIDIHNQKKKLSKLKKDFFKTKR